MIISSYYLFEEYHLFVSIREGRHILYPLPKDAVFALWRIHSHLTKLILFILPMTDLRFAVSVVPNSANCILIREEKENQYNH